MAEQGISLPGAFGGLMRYNEEYKSKFMLKPSQVIFLIVLFAIFVVGLNMFF
jgi:preprotein translocase subunit Sec61beta